MENNPNGSTLTVRQPNELPVSAHESQTYSVTETAQVLGVSAVTVYRLIDRGQLRPLANLRHKRIPKRQVQAYLEGSSILGRPEWGPTKGRISSQ